MYTGIGKNIPEVCNQFVLTATGISQCKKATRFLYSLKRDKANAYIKVYCVDCSRYLERDLATMYCWSKYKFTKFCVKHPDAVAEWLGMSLQNSP